ncbi:GATA zinc finger domain-containing protein 14-like [Condylostylus longicornis]|uniref:GATA zinc finger domain-containing protein 14-like n=1 Tax=Condylostylus longicornis TaxID=2530218 RepID=UPI00244DDD0C|nr:GATA zinc finger domain-containing protein 14-like [Condylostylus longicornis]
MKTDEDENVFVPANLDKNEIVEDQIESSGDGPVEVSSKEHDSSKLRENFDELPETLSKVDPKLKSQLQRLSQIIDGLQNTYKNKKNSTSNELRPDQLNAFLAHFNIKNEFDSFNPNNDDFKIENFGYRRQDYNNDESSSGHSNSQIVVNRPEGSVVFSLANPQKPYQEQKYNDVNKHDPFDYNTVPKISEETLKTVLELSKQMISNQNVRQVLPNMGGIYQPILTPLYYPPMPSHSYHFHTTGGSPDIKYPNYHSNIQNHYHELPEKDDEKYDKFTSTAYITNNKKHKPEKTTVIQNSVIPVHITTHSDKGIIKRPEISSFSGNRHDSIADENDFNQIPELPTNLNNQYLSPSKSILNPNFAISSTSTSAPMTTATTTERPYQYPPSPPTNHMSFLNYYTPNPHLDDSNANSIFENADEGHYPILSGQYQHNKKPSYYYQTNIKVPSSQSQSNQNIQIQPQQPQYLLNMGMNSIGNSINANINEGMEQMNEYESNSSPLSSLNYHMGNSLSNDLNKQKYTQFVTNQLTHQTNLDQQYSYLNENHNLHSALSTGSSSSLPSSSSASTTTLTNILPHNNNYHNNGINSVGPNALVNLGGNYISYDIYKNKLLPALESAAGLNTNNNNNNNNGMINNNQLIQPNVEIVTCTAGIRQPNSTDCTKYFVCSRKDSKVLSYSCPPYTAFNSQTRICDAKTYAICNPEILFNKFTIQENQKLKFDAIKALQDAKKIRDEAIKAQTLANLIRLQTEQTLNQTMHTPISNPTNFLNPTIFSDFLSSYTSVETPISGLDGMDNGIMTSTITSTSSTTTIKPILSLLHHKHKKRKYYCREGDKIPDQTSNSNYFICYKTKDGAMHGHKMICSLGLIFCPKTKLCTTARLCEN